MPTHSLFVSDLHLSPELPHATGLFRRFLTEVAPRAQALYILGDLFEAWIGDDDLDDAFHAGIAAGLAELAGQGTALYLLHGNRDFLLGEDFCRVTGARLLPDPVCVDLYGTSTVLSHGDLLCTDDTDYQAFRRQVRNPAYQAALLAKPLGERRRLAQALRRESDLAKTGKATVIMDVNAEAVADCLRRYGYPRLIHGHTHRPGRYEHRVDGHRCERWVLPDWYAGGGYLRCSAAGCELVTLR